MDEGIEVRHLKRKASECYLPNPFPKKIKKLSDSQPEQDFKRYTAVFRNSKSGLYFGQFTHGQRRYWCGSHIKLIDAIRAVNLKCKELDIGLKNPDFDLETPKQKESTKIIGVTFNKGCSKYAARLFFETHAYHCGYFLNELEAGQAVNAKCVEFGIPLKNPELGLPAAVPKPQKKIQTDRDDDHKLNFQYINGRNQEKIISKLAKKTHDAAMRPKQSNFKSVYWNKRMRKWNGYITYNKKTIWCGSADTQTKVAELVNLKCEELGIPLKNPHVKKTTSREMFVTNYYGNFGYPSNASKQNAVVHRHRNQFYHENSRHVNDAAITLSQKYRNLDLPVVKAPGLKTTVASVMPTRHPYTSSYKNVCWYGRYSKWRASIEHKGQHYFLGYSTSDRLLAIKVNEKCRELGIPVKNPELLEENLNNLKGDDSQMTRSRFKCVYWNKRSLKWHGYIHKGGKQIYCGCSFDDQYVAILVNQKCREINIPLKNPDLAHHLSSSNSKMSEEKQRTSNSRRKNSSKKRKRSPVNESTISHDEQLPVTNRNFRIRRPSPDKIEGQTYKKDPKKRKTIKENQDKVKANHQTKRDNSSVENIFIKTRQEKKFVENIFIKQEPAMNEHVGTTPLEEEVAPIYAQLNKIHAQLEKVEEENRILKDKNMKLENEKSKLVKTLTGVIENKSELKVQISKLEAEKLEISQQKMQSREQILRLMDQNFKEKAEKLKEKEERLKLKEEISKLKEKNLKLRKKNKKLKPVQSCYVTRL